MRDLMRLLWAHSNADAPASARREQVGFLFDSAGVLVYRADLNNPVNTPCRSSCVVPLIGRGVAAATTHPFRPGELLPASCNPNDPELRKYSVDRFGGASELDLLASWHWGVPIYILDKESIYLIPRGATRENARAVAKRYPRVDPATGCSIY
jgi:hypothetical protein